MRQVRMHISVHDVLRHWWESVCVLLVQHLPTWIIGQQHYHDRVTILPTLWSHYISKRFRIRGRTVQQAVKPDCMPPGQPCKLCSRLEQYRCMQAVVDIEAAAAEVKSILDARADAASPRSPSVQVSASVRIPIALAPLAPLQKVERSRYARAVRFSGANKTCPTRELSAAHPLQMRMYRLVSHSP